MTPPTYLTQESKTQPIVSHWHRNLTIGIVTDDKALQIQGMPEPAVKSILLPVLSDVRYTPFLQRWQTIILPYRISLERCSNFRSLPMTSGF